MRSGVAILAMIATFVPITHPLAATPVADATVKTTATVVGRFYGTWSDADPLPASLTISKRGRSFVVELSAAAPGNHWMSATVRGYGTNDRIVFRIPRRFLAHGRAELTADADGTLKGYWTHTRDGRTVVDAVRFQRGLYDYGDSILATSRP